MQNHLTGSAGAGALVLLVTELFAADLCVDVRRWYLLEEPVAFGTTLGVDEVEN